MVRYRNTRYSQARLATGNMSPRSQKYQKDYTTTLSGAKRHQFLGAVSTVASIAAGVYGHCELLSFKRTFSGATSDTPDTATVGNNYQSTAVMNGSRIENFKAKITIKNTSASKPWVLDVYESCVSFWDVLVWNTQAATLCPFQIDTSTVGPPDIRGQVTLKTPALGLVSNNNWRNYKFAQHYLKFKGSITLGTTDGSPNPQAEIIIPRAHPKAVRSNTGMFWSYFFVNDSDKNGAGVFAGEVTKDISFDEVPSDNRLPYVY